MICPKCMVQMHQKRIEDIPVGGGKTDGIAEYVTHELKQCPSCERLTLEFYGAYWVTTVADADELAKKLQAL